MSSLAVRAERARSGSKRKRDLQALAEVDDITLDEALQLAETAEEEQASPDAFPDDITPDPNAAGAWAKILATLRPTLPESAYLRWLEPVEAIGSRDGVLCLATPRSLDWYRRRYGAAVDELARLNGYDGFAIYGGPTR